MYFFVLYEIRPLKKYVLDLRYHTSFAIICKRIGFAIPANLIQKVVSVLIEIGNCTHPYLGFSGNTLASDLAANIENITHEGRAHKFSYPHKRKSYSKPGPSFGGSD